jgi:hypothetical protein
MGRGAEAYTGDVMDDYEGVQTDPPVLEGEDDLPRQPAARRDPFVPEPGPPPGEQRAIGLVLWAALR